MTGSPTNSSAWHSRNGWRSTPSGVRPSAPTHRYRGAQGRLEDEARVKRHPIAQHKRLQRAPVEHCRDTTLHGRRESPLRIRQRYVHLLSASLVLHQSPIHLVDVVAAQRQPQRSNHRHREDHVRRQRLQHAGQVARRRGPIENEVVLRAPVRQRAPAGPGAPGSARACSCAASSCAAPVRSGHRQLLAADQAQQTSKAACNNILIIHRCLGQCLGRRLAQR